MNKIFNPITVIIFVVAAVIFTIFMIYETPISSGYIIKKEFIAYHEWTTEEEDCIDISSIPICIEYTDHHSAPDTWYITIKNENDDGEIRTRTVKVPEDLYEKSKQGKYFMVPGENDE